MKSFTITVNGNVYDVTVCQQHRCGSHKCACTEAPAAAPMQLAENRCI